VVEHDRILASAPAAKMHAMAAPPPFAELAPAPDAPLDLVALALAAEFRAVDADAALARLDALGAELAGAEGPAEAQARACAELLGGVHGFAGDRERYDHPDNSMLDVVLERRSGLPILLSVVYVEVARRAGIELAAVGLPGHFVVGHLGAAPPVLLDPFAGGAPVAEPVAPELVRAWPVPEIAMRMLNNLMASYSRRGDLGRALRAAELRLALPAEAQLREALRAELRALRARLN
jgi:regulator of sirC expression with transglutaminase-like and TPR domain